MSVKTNGTEFKAFYSDKEFWLEGTYHEDTMILVDGKDINVTDQDPEKVDDTAVITLCYGVVFNKQHEEISGFEAYFKKWRKLQSTSTIMVEVHKDKLDAVKAAIKAAGGTVK
jgi:hypothetical protein